MKYLVTGSAGFVGFHLTKALLEKGESIVGLDNANDYYDVNLKYARLKELGIEPSHIDYNTIIQSSKYLNFQFIKLDIEDKSNLFELYKIHSFDFVFNLAGQAGVTYSTINPQAYVQSNIIGFLNILECCKIFNVRLIYASSSSVYGDNEKLPFSENDLVIHPKNLYAKSKILNEYLAGIYIDHFNIQAIGLRFFSIYGAWGRPDMAIWIFTKAILSNTPIPVYGNGYMERDFTFVGDVVKCILRIVECSLSNKPLKRIYNIGASNPIKLLDLIHMLEHYFHRKANVMLLPMRSEDIQRTHADVTNLCIDIGYVPNSAFEEKLHEFTQWYIDYITDPT
jgi:UDP-glucuronate 4-epimerase